MHTDLAQINTDVFIRRRLTQMIVGFFTCQGEFNVTVSRLYVGITASMGNLYYYE